MPEFRVLSTNDFNPAVPGYRKRRVFAKTRAGCLSCKLKKVKCDEMRPCCARCRRNSWHCAYSDEAVRNPGQKGMKPGIPSLSCTTVLPFSAPSATDGTPSLHLIQHCLGRWDDIFHVAPGDEIMSQLRSSTPVRNALLAIAASHLRHLAPGDVRHRVAEHFQQSLAIRGHQELLATPMRALGQDGVNAVLLNATLLSMLVFPLPAFEDGQSGSGSGSETSWTSSMGSNRLGWLTFQAGVRPLMRSMEPYFQESMGFLGAIFLGGGEKHWASRNLTVDVMPKRWTRFFGLDDSSAPFSSYSQILQVPVKAVAHLRGVEPTPTNAYIYLAFLAKTQREFHGLLLEQDEKALWLYGYWFGLLCRFEDVWWCRQRAWRDYTAILAWLQQRRLPMLPGAEGGLWGQMMAELEMAPFVSPQKKDEDLALVED